MNQRAIRHQRTPWRRATVAVWVALAVFAPALTATGAPHSAPGDEPLVVVGNLPEPEARVKPGHIAAVDAAARRMYYLYVDVDSVVHVVDYDLRPAIPQPVATGVLGPDQLGPSATSPYQAVVDSKRHHLLMMGTNVDVAGNVAQTLGSNILVYDTQHHRRADIWYPDRQLPGYFPFGMTYSEADDRIYMIGEMSENSSLANGFFGSKAVGAGTAVVALDPGTGALLWVRFVPECQQALNSLGTGGLIARSQVHPALYFSCTTGGSVLNAAYPGQAGVVRLTISPTAAATDASGFPLEFFPVSGQYFNGGATGIATFDPVSDRLFLQSLAESTPGAWVFDGRLSGWVGFIPAPDYSDAYAGYNPKLGHLYIGLNRITGDPHNGMVVADGRALPVQAGTVQKLPPSAFIVTDPKTDRLFMLPEDATSAFQPYLVVRDRFRGTGALQPLDYDALTDGVPEHSASFVNYSADVNAYGSDVVLVGGTSATLTTAGILYNQPPLSSQPPAGGGTRGLMLARLGGLGLRPAGASASARAVIADLNTTQDWETNDQLRDWPYPSVSCLDSGGGIEPQTSEVRGSRARVECDLADATSHGETSAAGLTAQGLSVGRASSVADTTRTTKTGATTTVSASSSDIEVAIPGLGQLRVGRVSATLTTVAHGVDGSATASYRRTVKNVELVGSDGQVLLDNAACQTTMEANGAKPATVTDTCAELAHAINQRTQLRAHLGFPIPDVIATPKGAFSAVQQGDADYYVERAGNDQGVVYPHDSAAQRPAAAMQLVVYSDTNERSRLVAQFAGVQGDSIFNTTADGDTPPPPPTGTEAPATPGVPDEPPAQRVDGSVPAGPTVDGPATAEPPVVVAQPLSGVAGWLFMHRSLRDALLIAGILGIAAAAGALAYRRHQLLAAMTATTGGPSA
jgi:hypothetical protein